MLVELKDIPPEAICHVCGGPMKVLHHEHRALALGLKIPEGGIFTIECHGFQLRIEDEEAEREVVKLLEAYHSSKVADETGEPEPISHTSEGVGQPQRA